MSLVFERISTDGIAELSYLLGDDKNGSAAVFDPTPDADRYIELARRNGVAITHVFETHIHADLVSGARELCARLGLAKVHASGEGGAEYGFEHEPVRDGDRFTFGGTMVTACHTPGHTPEHMSYLLAETEHAEAPWGVLTGDSLFVGSAGRPDLLGSDETEELTRRLFETLCGFYLNLRDEVMIFPAHGAGSPCGADIGDRMQSTIGYERRFNPFLGFSDYDEFKEHALANAPPVPSYYPRMKKVNARGPEVLGHHPRVPDLPPAAFQQALRDRQGVLVDTRTMLAFGGGHIPGALHIGGTPLLSIWAGWMLDPDEPILLVDDDEGGTESVVRRFLRTGYTKFAGRLAGGMKGWIKAGFPLETLRQMPVHELHEALDGLQVLDVRGRTEWDAGHVPGAMHIFVPEVREKACGSLAKDQPVAVYCGSGYRASIAASVLKQSGFQDVRNVPGSWQAWRAAGYETATEEEG